MHTSVLLDKVLDHLELGDWRRALELVPQLSGGAQVAIAAAVQLRLTGGAMRARAQGAVAQSSRQLEVVARLLPSHLRESCDDHVRARLVPQDAGVTPDQLRTCRIARLVWREQYELDHLRLLFADLKRGYDELLEACVEYLCVVDHNPATWFSSEVVLSDPPAERARTDLLERATRLRQFGNPLLGRPKQVSESVWKRHGQFRALYSDALDRLAERPAAVVWAAEPGAAVVVPHQGFVCAWTLAQLRKEPRRSVSGGPGIIVG